MKIPKAVSALKALLLGIPVALPDGVTYKYVQADGDDRPKIWAVGTRIKFGVNHDMSVEQIKAQIDKALDCPADDAQNEEVLLDSDITLNEFILECARMTEFQWVLICSAIALNTVRLQQQEKRGSRDLKRMIEDNDFAGIAEEVERRGREVSGTGPSPLEGVVKDLQHWKKIEDAAGKMRERHAMYNYSEKCRNCGALKIRTPEGSWVCPVGHKNLGEP